MQAVDCQSAVESTLELGAVGILNWGYVAVDGNCVARRAG